VTGTINTETVFLVDDDPGVLKALSRVLRGEGWTVETYDSAEAFLARPATAMNGCIVLDVTMPGLDGLELQRQLRETDRVLPIVFVSGHGDIPLSVKAIKAGATDFLTKPVQAHALIAAVRSAIADGASARAARAESDTLHQRLASLTSREREVFRAVAMGRLNKQIAGDLGIVEQTVKFHRAHIMERMQAKTVAELMHMAARLGLAAALPKSASAADDRALHRRQPGRLS
jgi:FixJ family two-component response regulator